MALLKANITPPGAKTGNDLSKEVEALRRELFELYNALSFVLSNIDSDNFSDKGLKEIKERIDVL